MSEFLLSGNALAWSGLKLSGGLCCAVSGFWAPACCAGPLLGHGRMPGRLLDPEADNEIIIELDESNVISDTLAGLSHPGIWKNLPALWSDYKSFLR